MSTECQGPFSPRVLQFGWEFAPILSGGLGVACAGLSRALGRLGVDVTFVLPSLPQPVVVPGVEVLAARSQAPLRPLPGAGITEVRVESTLGGPYRRPRWRRSRRGTGASAEAEPSRVEPFALYGGDLFGEVGRLADAAGEVAARVSHDLIHCHDWMTFEAGRRARAVSGRPLVVHVHSTEHDRSGGSPHPEVFRREREGLEAADLVVAVSEFTRRRIVEQYGIPEAKIAVVHNGIDGEAPFVERAALADDRPIVLFLGRLTVQKGAEWFLRAAKRVIAEEPDVLFVIAGSGDMEEYLVEQVAETGLGANVLFSGFLRGEDVERAYRTADVYVMPSVSEPFGIAPLEAMRQGTPVIISRQSGVSEVVRNCFKVDFWDVEELAARIVGLLRYPELREALGVTGRREVARLGWDRAAEQLLGVYRELLHGERT